MVVVVIVLAVLVLALFVVLGTARSSLTAARSQVDALRERLDSTTDEAERAAADATEARSRADAATARAVAAESQRDESARRLRDAEAAALSAEERAATAESAAARSLDAMGTWALDTLRLDRLWRDQVAPGRAEDSPFATSSDPAHAAVEILCATVREGSGTPVDLKWGLVEPLPPVPGSRVVRTIEELLAFARAADSASLVVEAGDQAVLVQLGTEPDLAVPDHLLAALDAAGVEVSVDPHVSVLNAQVPWPAESPGWPEA